MINKEIDPKNIPEISEDYKFLDFEKTIQDISEKITALKNSAIDSSELNNQINTLRKERDVETKKIYSKLSIWQTVQVARHPQRPHTLDFIDRIFDDFDDMSIHKDFAESNNTLSKSIESDLSKVNIDEKLVSRYIDEPVRLKILCIKEKLIDYKYQLFSKYTSLINKLLNN